MAETVIVSIALGALIGFVTGEARGYVLGRRDRQSRQSPMRYADDPENRGGGMLYWRVTCHKCLKYGEWESSRTIQLDNNGQWVGMHSPGFTQVESVWFCNQCAQDVRSYALETLT